MTDMSTTHKDEIVNHIFRTTTFTQPTVMAVALLTTSADDANTGVFTSGTGVEVTDLNGYVRQDIGSLNADWVAPTDGLTSNVAKITFPTVVTSTWGTINGIGLVSSVAHNVGALYYHTDVTTPKALAVDDIAEFAIGAITVQFD